MDRLRADFLSLDQRLVVFSPDRGERRNGYQYSYHTVEEIRELCSEPGADHEVPGRVASWLDRIVGFCRRCRAPARVALFPADVLHWEVVPRALGVLSDHPRLGGVTAEPDIVCHACAAADVCRALLASPADRGFDEGVTSPLGCAEGILFTTQPTAFG